MIDVYNVSHEEIREDLFATNHPSGNPTSLFSSHTNLTSPEGPIHSISEPETKSSSSSPTLISLEESELIWEEFEAYLASDSFPLGNSNPSSLLPPFHNSLSGLREMDDLPFDGEFDLLELEVLLTIDPIKEMDSILEDSVDENSLDDNLDDTISEIPLMMDVYDDPFDFKEEKIKDSKILIDELDLPESNNVLPFLECDSVFYEDFSEVDALPSTNNEDKATNASVILEDFNPPLSLYELPFHKEVPGLGAVLSFSSKNEEKVYNHGILTSKRVHTSLLPELSHRGTKAFKVTKILESPMEIFPCFLPKRTSEVLDVPCLHFYPP
ncbi:hypothetical protein Tco_0300156 [Tanacetum coccineum]